MKHKLLVILSILLPLFGECKIIETSRVEDAIPYFTQDTWFLVDLDNTLFEGKQALGHADWFYDELQKRQDSGMSREEAFRDFYPEWIRTQAICQVKPLEEAFPLLIRTLQAQEITVMGLTHRQPPVAEATIRQVRSLGIDFTQTAPFADTFCICAKNPTLYLEGVLFVGDFNKKSEIFVPFIERAGHLPAKIVFIDDKRKNVEDLETVLSPRGIEYVGIHYTAIENVPKVYSRELAEFQYRFLDAIMSNEAATVLINNKLGN